MGSLQSVQNEIDLNKVEEITHFIGQGIALEGYLTSMKEVEPSPLEVKYLINEGVDISSEKMSKNPAKHLLAAIVSVMNAIKRLIILLYKKVKAFILKLVRDVKGIAKDAKDLIKKVEEVELSAISGKDSEKLKKPNLLEYAEVMGRLAMTVPYAKDVLSEEFGRDSIFKEWYMSDGSKVSDTMGEVLNPLKLHTLTLRSKGDEHVDYSKPYGPLSKGKELQFYVKDDIVTVKKEDAKKPYAKSHTRDNLVKALTITSKVDWDLVNKGDSDMATIEELVTRLVDTDIEKAIPTTELDMSKIHAFRKELVGVNSLFVKIGLISTQESIAIAKDIIGAGNEWLVIAKDNSSPSKPGTKRLN